MPELAQLDRATLAATTTNRALTSASTNTAAVPTTTTTTTTTNRSHPHNSNQLQLEHFNTVGDQSISASFSSATAGGRRRRQLRGNGGNVIGQLLASLDLRFADPTVESHYYNYYAQVKRHLLPTAIQVVLLVNLLQLLATCLHFYYLSGQQENIIPNDDRLKFNRSVSIATATEDETFFRKKQQQQAQEEVNNSNLAANKQATTFAYSRTLFIPVIIQLFILIGTFMMLKMVRQELDPSGSEKLGRRRFSSAGFNATSGCGIDTGKCKGRGRGRGKGKGENKSKSKGKSKEIGNSGNATNQVKQTDQQRQQIKTTGGDDPGKGGKSVLSASSSSSETSSGDDNEDYDDGALNPTAIGSAEDTHIKDYTNNMDADKGKNDEDGDQDEDEDDEDNEDKALKGNESGKRINRRFKKGRKVESKTRKEHYKGRRKKKKKNSRYSTNSAGLSTSLSLTIDPIGVHGDGHSFISSDDKSSSDDDDEATDSDSASSTSSNGSDSTSPLSPESSSTSSSSSHSDVDQNHEKGAENHESSVKRAIKKRDKNRRRRREFKNLTTTTTSTLNSFTTTSSASNHSNNPTKFSSERRSSHSHSHSHSHPHPHPHHNFKLSRCKLSLPYILWFCQVLQLASGLWPQQSFISYSMLLLYSYTIYVIFPIRLMSCILLALGLSLSQPLVDYLLLLNLQSTLTLTPPTATTSTSQNVLFGGMLPTPQTLLYAPSDQQQQQQQANQTMNYRQQKQIVGGNIFEAQFLPLTSGSVSNEPAESRLLNDGGNVGITSDLSSSLQQPQQQAINNVRLNRNVLNLILENSEAADNDNNNSNDNVLVMDHSLLIPMTSQLSKVSENENENENMCVRGGAFSILLCLVHINNRCLVGEKPFNLSYFYLHNKLALFRTFSSP